MRAAVFRRGDIVVGDVTDPVPGPGQVLVKTLSCGICGSDLHAARHAPHIVEMSRRTPGRVPMDLSRDVVFGHEFCGEVLEYGPGTPAGPKAGTRVCAMPVMLRGDAPPLTIGYSNDYPGGFGERMVLSAALLVAVPNGLSSAHAALTEPLAVGIHAVEKAALASDDAALVVGCGPVGLAAIVGLRLKGTRPIIAVDFSSRRRELAGLLGADVVVDPAHDSAYRHLPLGRRAVIFECVGVQGLIQQVFEGAPRGARVVVAGVCMEPDRIEPLFAILKELSVQFVLGYTPEEFARSLRLLAEGAVDADALITGTVGLDGVKGAFAELASPDRHTKILIEPWR